MFDDADMRAIEGAAMPDPVPNPMQGEAPDAGDDWYDARRDPVGRTLQPPHGYSPHRVYPLSFECGFTHIDGTARVIVGWSEENTAWFASAWIDEHHVFAHGDSQQDALASLVLCAFVYGESVGASHEV